MAMLAGARNKRKISINPNGNHWSKDKSNFGHKLLKKYGWTEGKGLGVNEDGNAEHIKVDHKVDNRGMGYTKNQADNWIAHQDDFNSILAQLNQGVGDNNDTEVSSLENMSKKSRTRVHYQKFTKGKDLSAKSSSDLDCIFGVRKIKESKDDICKEAQDSGKEPPEEEELSNYQHFTSTDSVQEYFAKKMAEKKSDKCDGNVFDPEDTVSNNSILPEEHDRKKDRKKKKKRKKEMEESDAGENITEKHVRFSLGEDDLPIKPERDECSTEVCEEKSSVVENCENIQELDEKLKIKHKKSKKRKRQKDSFEEMSGNKNELCETTSDEQGDETIQNSNSASCQQTLDEVNNDVQSDRNKKNKKKAKRKLEENIDDTADIGGNRKMKKLKKCEINAEDNKIKIKRKRKEKQKSQGDMPQMQGYQQKLRSSTVTVDEKLASDSLLKSQNLPRGKQGKEIPVNGIDNKRKLCFCRENVEQDKNKGSIESTEKDNMSTANSGRMKTKAMLRRERRKRKQAEKKIAEIFSAKNSELSKHPNIHRSEITRKAKSKQSKKSTKAKITCKKSDEKTKGVVSESKVNQKVTQTKSREKDSSKLKRRQQALIRINPKLPELEDIFTFRGASVDKISGVYNMGLKENKMKVDALTKPYPLIRKTKTVRLKGESQRIIEQGKIGDKKVGNNVSLLNSVQKHIKTNGRKSFQKKSGLKNNSVGKIMKKHITKKKKTSLKTSSKYERNGERSKQNAQNCLVLKEEKIIPMTASQKRKARSKRRALQCKHTKINSSRRNISSCH